MKYRLCTFLPQCVGHAMLQDDLHEKQTVIVCFSCKSSTSIIVVLRSTYSIGNLEVMHTQSEPLPLLRCLHFAL